MTPTGHITLSQLQNAIRETLAATFRGPVWTIAEIADLKVNHSSGHCYLELVEKGSANGVPKAQARAVIWRQSYGMLSAYFKGATGHELAVGMKVLVNAAVTYHELYGLSLQISDIDPMYTIGDMERQRQQTIEQLKEDGVFDLNRELTMPEAIQRIAVVSSPGAAGLRDFLKELESSVYRFETELFEALMQGHGAEESIINALQNVAANMENFDAVVIIRGGGSQSDLNFLNSYLLSFNVAQFPLPVISGLGHDKDQSVLDMISAVSLKTPTAVASYLINKSAGIDSKLEYLFEMIYATAMQSVSQENNRIVRLAEMLLRKSGELRHGIEIRLMRTESRLAELKNNIVLLQGNRISSLEILLPERAGNIFRSSRIKLEGYGRDISARDPQKILSMGFAIVRYKGSVVRSSSQVSQGDALDITLSRGKITAKTEDNGKR